MVLQSLKAVLTSILLVSTMLGSHGKSLQHNQSQMQQFPLSYSKEKRFLNPIYFLGQKFVCNMNYHVKRLHYENKTVPWEPLPFHLYLICHYLPFSELPGTPVPLWLVINWTNRVFCLLAPRLSYFDSFSLLEQSVIWIKDISSNSKTLRQMWLKAGIFLIQIRGQLHQLD